MHFDLEKKKKMFFSWKYTLTWKFNRIFHSNEILIMEPIATVTCIGKEEKEVCERDHIEIVKIRKCLLGMKTDGLLWIMGKS